MLIISMIWHAWNVEGYCVRQRLFEWVNYFDVSFMLTIALVIDFDDQEFGIYSGSTDIVHYIAII